MDTKDQKINIIIKEIQFWKQNKMLPEHYCDYLLALYKQGEELEDPGAGKIKYSPFTMILSVMIIALIPVSLFVIYFTELSFVLQTAILTGFVVSLIFSGFYYSKKEIMAPVIYISTALIVLIYSVNAVDVYFDGNPLVTYIILFSNCLLWIGSGWFLKLLYFSLAGGVGLIVLIVSIAI